MYVAKVKLENVRGFHDARRVDLDLSRTAHDSYAGWTVLVGHNGSGKTTLLRAIALALAGPETARALAGEAPGWVSVGKERAGIELDLAGGLYVGLTLTADGVEVESNISRADFLCVGYGPYRRLGGGGPSPGHLAGLFRADLSLSVGWLTRQPEVKEIVQRVVWDGLLKEGVDLAGLRELGEGRRTLVAMVVDLMRQMHQAYGTLPLHPERPVVVAPGVVLVDEVEAHLHPVWQQRVGDWLKEHFPAVQFLVSTNSPLVCQSADPRGLIHLPPEDEPRAPYVVEDDLYRRVVFGSAEDALLSDLFGLDSAFSPRARRMRQELVDLELKVLDGQASEVQIARYRELQELLVSSPAARAQEIEARLVRGKSAAQATMIYIRRIPLPGSLAQQLAGLTAILHGHGDQAKQHARTLWNRSREPRRGLRDALNQMAPGYQRCMYCGDSEGTSVDHFEPIARNPLRTFDWRNHLLACSFCNSNQKGSRFPVDEAGLPLLIDPSLEDPFKHLALSLAVGEYRARTPKGTATIEVLALNRAVLVSGRVHARYVVGQALRLWRAGQKVGDGREQARQIATVRMQPLADVHQAMLRYAVADAAQVVFSAEPDLLDILRDPELRSSLPGASSAGW